MAGKKHIVELMYDTLSPFAYMTFEVLSRCSRHWETMDLKLTPVLLGAIFKAHGTTHQHIPARRNYQREDLDRLATYFNVPLRFPDNFKTYQTTGSLKAQRILTAASIYHPEKLEQLSRQFFRRVWIEHGDIVEDMSIVDICLQAGLDSNETVNLVDLISQQEIKDRLKNATVKAVEDGVFGVPTYFLRKGEQKTMIWGTDRLFLLADYLGESWPLPTS